MKPWSYLSVLIWMGIGQAAFALETVYTPFKDGYANLQHYNGTSRAIKIRSGDNKGWLQHALPKGAGDDLQNARLSLFVSDVVRDGTLKVYLALSPRGLESQTRYDELKAQPEPIGTIVIKAREHMDEQVSVALTSVFVDAVKQNTFYGLILEGADGLEAELGSLENSRGGLLYLTYSAGQKISQETLDTLAARVISQTGGDVNAVIGPQGDPGPKGDKGDTGPAGPSGAAAVLSQIPGKASIKQIDADSVNGLAVRLGAKADTAAMNAALASKANAAAMTTALAAKADMSALSAKANLSGANFTGKLGVGVTNPNALLDINVTSTAFDVDTTLAIFTHRTSGGRTADLRLLYRGSTLGDGWLAFREDRAGLDFLNVNMLSSGAGRRVVFPNGRLGVGTSTPGAAVEIHSGGDETMTGSWGNTLKLSANRYPAIRFFSEDSNRTSTIGNNNDGSLYFGINGVGENFVGQHHSLVLGADSTVNISGRTFIKASVEGQEAFIVSQTVGGDIVNFRVGHNVRVKVSQDSTSFYQQKLIVNQTTPAVDIADFQASGASRFRVGYSGNATLNGNLAVSGSLSKGSGTFDIPHPDPEKEAKGMHLRHSFVESPTRGDNIYRYKVQVRNSIAVIALPDYFRFLNDEPQIWITPVGQFGQAFGEVDSELREVTIRADRDGIYNVLLIATRKDRLAREGWDKLGLEYIKSVDSTRTGH